MRLTISWQAKEVIGSPEMRVKDAFSRSGVPLFRLMTIAFSVLVRSLMQVQMQYHSPPNHQHPHTRDKIL